MATNYGMGGTSTPGGPGQPGAPGSGMGPDGTGGGYMNPGGNGGIRNQSGNALVTGTGTVLPITNTLALPITVTQGYFSNNAGLLQGNSIHTGTLSDSNEKYYFNVTNTHPQSASAEVQFSVAFGHKGGSGSNVLASNETPTLKGETQAVYSQFATLLLAEGQVSGGFQISNQGSAGQLSAGTPDDYIYVLVASRERFKDKLDNKSWTIKLKGRDSAGAETGVLSLTDDSDSSTQTGSFADTIGPRYNIVSGAAGTVHTSSAHRTFGFFYPWMGTMVFSGAELSASIPGPTTGDGAAAPITSNTASFNASSADGLFRSSSGFAPNLYDEGYPNNALKFVNCLRNIGTEDIRLRGSQEQNKKSFFCTVNPQDCNFSTNATFVSGSEGKLRHKSMYNNPNVYITGIGLHDTNGNLMAVAKMSTPVQKNFGTQTTIKVNLTY